MTHGEKIAMTSTLGMWSRVAFAAIVTATGACKANPAREKGELDDESIAVRTARTLRERGEPIGSYLLGEEYFMAAGEAVSPSAQATLLANGIRMFEESLDRGLGAAGTYLFMLMKGIDRGPGAEYLGISMEQIDRAQKPDAYWLHIWQQSADARYADAYACELYAFANVSGLIDPQNIDVMEPVAVAIRLGQALNVAVNRARFMELLRKAVDEAASNMGGMSQAGENLASVLESGGSTGALSIGKLPPNRALAEYVRARWSLAQERQERFLSQLKSQADALTDKYIGDGIEARIDREEEDRDMMSALDSVIQSIGTNTP